MVTLGFCNNITNRIIKTMIDSYIQIYCAKYSTQKIKIEPALVKAIIKQESRFIPYCVRYEKHLKTNEKYLDHIPKKHRTNKLAYSSLGIMQVLYGTARWMKFKGEPEDLLLLKNSLKYGIIYIRDLIRRYYTVEKVISSYNQGSPKRNKNGDFKNQKKYVDPVLKFYREFNGKIDIK
jgi:soluble lytic murein transglycosylase-like protein